MILNGNQIGIKIGFTNTQSVLRVTLTQLNLNFTSENLNETLKGNQSQEFQNLLFQLTVLKIHN